MNNCPDCNRGLRDDAIRCACGWSALDVKQPLKIDCAHMECNQGAMMKIKTSTGLAKVCHKHYLQHFQDKAEENCVKLNLLTSTQCREWLRNNKLRFKRIQDAA